MIYFLFGGEPDSEGKGADSFIGAFTSIEAAVDYFNKTPARDPFTRISWGQVAAWDGTSLTVIYEARETKTFPWTKTVSE